MTASQWRIAALSCIAIAIGFVLSQMTFPDREDFGVRGKPTQGGISVISVQAGSPAAKVGIHSGDRLTYGTSVADRARVLYATGGSHVTVTLNGTRQVTLIARSHPPVAPWISTIIRLAFLLVAGLLAWRRPDDRATRSLVFFLVCYGLAISMNNGLLPTPLLTFIVLQIFNIVLFLAGTAAIGSFASRFPSGSARPLARIFAGVAQLFAVLAILAIIIDLTAANLSFPINQAVLATFVIIGLFVLLTLIAAYVQGDPSERQRRRWVFLILAIGLAGPLVDIIVQGTYGLIPWVDELSIVPLGFMPIGLAYVILRHRVIDVGFVINRAVVYTGVSFIIVAIFVIVETLLSKFVIGNRTESIAVQLGVALILGFSIRAIHNRVDHFVDTILFRERYRDRAAIRFFTHDAPYISDAEILLSRCVKIVERYAHTEGAAIWVAQSPRYDPAASTFSSSPSVDENDPAMVAMRARRVCVELREVDSALPGAIAFPMIVRGELIGTLVCGPKRDDEVYDPDERETLAALALSVGHALDGIQVRELRERLHALSGPSPIATNEGPTQV